MRPIQSGDDAARERIKNSLDESLIVEAAAGTGKTTELIGRIVAGFAAGKIRAESLVAVTFTRKAAGELKLRLRQELDRALEKARKVHESPSPPAPLLQGSEGRESRDEVASATPPNQESANPQEQFVPSDERAIANLEAAIANLEQAHIGTIHSFCAEILRERPVEANVDPAFSELSDPETQRIYRQAFRRWSQEKLTASPPGLRRCLSRLAARSSSEESSPLEQVESAGWKLAQWRDFSKPWQRRPFEREREIDRLVLEIKRVAELSNRCTWKSDDLFQTLRPARDLAIWVERAELATGRVRRNERDYDALEGRLLIVLKELRRQTKKGRGKFAEGVTREAVVAAREAVVQSLEDFKRQADADLAALLQQEMRELVERYDEAKRKAGALDFVDLLVKVCQVVKKNRDVRQYLQNKFSHVFVDEFQDTDPLQAEILLLLTADDPNETDCLKVTPKPGKLFVVGDPKQSVYRFRRADMVLYQRLRDSLENRGVPVLYLTKSFRAVPAIQECINAAFAPMMVKDLLTGQAAYVPLENYRREELEQPRVVALPAPRPYGASTIAKYAIDRSLPEAVAAFVSWLVNESGWEVYEGEKRVPVAPRHVCLLFRRFANYRTDMTRDYLQELEARGIPHLLVGGKSFHSREEVETLRAALTAIEWPDDDLSVFAGLKGSLFALPDTILLRFRDQFGSLHPFRQGLDDLSDEFKPVGEALQLLARLHRRRNWRPIVETVSELLEVTRAHAGFALRPAGNQALANVYRVCDLARSFELSGGISFRGFAEDLAEQAEREESPEAPVLEEGSDGVRVMTVHAAKGLEFPVVILADITAKLSRENPEMYVEGRELCAMRLLDCSPWDLLDHESEESARDRAEGIRVAYVAATRARDLLVVPAVGDGPYDGWLAPLHLAIYPPMERRREAKDAPRCPPFGDDTVLERPFPCDAPPRFSVKPGLHRPELGAHEVVWWDPAKLPNKKTTNFGVRQKEILAKDPGGKAADESLQNYQEWKQRRDGVIKAGGQPRFNLSVVTEGPELPAGFETGVELASTEKAAGRPQGSRFGTLVHAILRDVDLGGSRSEIARLADLHGRVLGATPDEVAAAIEAVAAALNHPLLERARSARRSHRELPVMVKTDDGRLIEGNLDLAFLEHGSWNVVDFKTDAHLPTRQPLYVRQVQWYVYTLTRVTGAPAHGWLMSV